MPHDMQTPPQADSDFPLLVIPDVKLYSESYAFWAWDEANALTVYAHFQRHPDRPALWRAYATLLRGDAVHAVHSYGLPPSPYSPGHGSVYISIERPKQMWRLCVDGGAQRQTMAEHETSVITDGPATPLSMDLKLTYSAPCWTMAHGGADNKSVQSEHHEQTGRITGVIELGGKRFTLDCLGASDHSRGVRDTSSLRDGGSFFNAVFPSGRALTGTKMGFEPAASQLGYITIDGRVIQATRVTRPQARFPAVGQRGSFVVEGEDVTANVEYEATDRRALFTMIPPNYESVGLREGWKTPLFYCDWTCKLSWDGETGWGSWETARLGARD